MTNENYPVRIWEIIYPKKISLKLSRLEYLTLVEIMRSIDLCSYNRYERALYGGLLISIFSKLINKLISLKDKNTINLTIPEAIALLKVLHNFASNDILKQTIIYEIVNFIDRKI